MPHDLRRVFNLGIIRSSKRDRCFTTVRLKVHKWYAVLDGHLPLTYLLTKMFTSSMASQEARLYLHPPARFYHVSYLTEAVPQHILYFQPEVSSLRHLVLQLARRGIVAPRIYVFLSVFYVS